MSLSAPPPRPSIAGKLIAVPLGVLTFVIAAAFTMAAWIVGMLAFLLMIGLAAGAFCSTLFMLFFGALYLGGHQSIDLYYCGKAALSAFVAFVAMMSVQYIRAAIGGRVARIGRRNVPFVEVA